MGGGFGQSVMVADINGDGRDDVMVGAPMQTGLNGAYEAGAVFVYYGTGDNVRIHSLRGYKMSTLSIYASYLK